MSTVANAQQRYLLAEITVNTVRAIARVTTSPCSATSLGGNVHVASLPLFAERRPAASQLSPTVIVTRRIPTAIHANGR